MMPEAVHGDSSLTRYHDFSKRWVFLAREGRERGRKPIVLRSASFSQFNDSAKRLSRKELRRALRSLRCYPERETEQFATLLLYFYLFIHLRRGWTGFRDLWTRPSRRRAWSFLSMPWTWRARLRRHYREFIAELARVAQQTPPTNPPVTAWTISCQTQLTRENNRKHLTRVLSHSRTRPPGDESRVLGCWAAARELLALAVDDRNSVQVRRALDHYKLFISGRHAHFVGRGPLSKIARLDLLRLCEEYPDYLVIENNDQEFLENWFLARFSVWSAFKVAFRRFRKARFLLVGGMAVALEVGVFDFFGWQYGPAGVPVDLWRYLSVMPLAVALFLFALWPQVFRLLYPRLFAGAVFGWTSVIAAIGSEVLFTSKDDVTELRGEMLSMAPTTSLVILGVVVFLLPLFFLYQEAYFAIGMRATAGYRAGLIFLFLLAVVGTVGLVFVVGVEQMLCGDDAAECLRLHRFLLVVGCVISNYFAVITQLVWGDEGISSTLAGRGYADGSRSRAT